MRSPDSLAVVLADELRIGREGIGDAHPPCRGRHDRGGSRLSSRLVRIRRTDGTAVSDRRSCRQTKGSLMARKKNKQAQKDKKVQ